MRKGKFICLVLCSLFLYLAHDISGGVINAPSVNEPPKEAKNNLNNCKITKIHNGFFCCYRKCQSEGGVNNPLVLNGFYLRQKHDCLKPFFIDEGSFEYVFKDWECFDFSKRKAEQDPDVKLLTQKMEEFGKIIDVASKRHGLPKKLIGAVIHTESSWNVFARTKGAEGLMMLRRLTQKEVSVKNPYDPAQNILGGTEYLKKMSVMFGGIEMGLAAYRIGPTALRHVINDKNSKLPPNVEHYVKKVMRLYNSV